MAYVGANGVLHHYLQDGLGEDVILVHGLACSLAFWYPGVMVALRRKYRVLAYDLRGHGKSAMSRDGYTHVEMADDLVSLADGLGLGKFHLVGHSYGGLISISFALKHPNRLHSLTLADVPVDNDVAGPEGSGMDKYPELAMLEQLAKNPPRQANNGNVYTPFHQGRGSRKTAERWLKLLETTTARRDFATRKIFCDDLESLQTPTLLSYGLKSRWKDSAQNLKVNLSRNIVVYVQEAGHSHPWEKPGVFLHSWLEFISSLTGNPSAEKRKDLRYSLHLEVGVEAESNSRGRVAATTVNVSPEGVLLRSAMVFSKDDTVRLIFKDIGGDLELIGRVIRCEPDNDDHLLAIDLGNDFNKLKLFDLYLQDTLTRTAPLPLISLSGKGI